MPSHQSISPRFCHQTSFLPLLLPKTFLSSYKKKWNSIVDSLVLFFCYCLGGKNGKGGIIDHRFFSGLSTNSSEKICDGISVLVIRKKRRKKA